jgi:hypothetical protein
MSSALVLIPRKMLYEGYIALQQPATKVLLAGYLNIRDLLEVTKKWSLPLASI